MQVSVIVTVYNEQASIERLLRSLAAQTRRPDEVVICDGGSQDSTVAIIRAFATRFPEQLPNLRVLVEPGANISRGRNVAIRAAQGPIIAATDAGVRLEPTWLEQLVAPWAAGGEPPLAVAGFFVPDAEGVFPIAMAATVLPLEDEIDPRTFLPSSRSVAFTKNAWAQAGGYPEWLDYCEDLLFDFALNAQRPELPTAFVWAPAARVHFRPALDIARFLDRSTIGMPGAMGRRISGANATRSAMSPTAYSCLRYWRTAFGVSLPVGWAGWACWLGLHSIAGAPGSA